MNADIENVINACRQGCTRDVIAGHYGRALVHQMENSGKGLEWGEANRAVLSRFKKSGLDYIRESAWKYARGENDEQRISGKNI